MKKNLVVIGGGAAGYFCAVNAARFNRNLQVTILEKSGKILSKVRVSGGGRCNVTHACGSISEMVKKYPRGGNFVKKAFHRFFISDTIKWFEERGVQLKTEKDGRMFPVSDSSQTIVDCLVNDARENGVRVITNTSVVHLGKKGDEFELALSNSTVIHADFVCVACGGYPKSNMFDWLTKLSHTIESPVPSLFTFNMPGNSITNLMGVSVEHTTVKIVGTGLEESGPILVTHWGLSGPAVLKLSAWAARELATRNYEFSVLVNWVAGQNEQQLKEMVQHVRFQVAAQKIVNRNPFQLPQRLWEYLLEQTSIPADLRWADLPGKDQNKLIKNLCAQEFAVKGKTTFKDEFVTAGGINLAEIDGNTMMSRLVPGLYFAGEVLNVDGVTGGYNFQHAWTSGYIAAASIAEVS
ncbi:MAG TPA: NAD(P)/FAD-dependent oxidoreductase [Chitinophagaceae bacterium]|nr:NAD(P)/FAD-dependent oxidoreductase [Chitinophagaceae bacterium]